MSVQKIITNLILGLSIFMVGVYFGSRVDSHPTINLGQAELEAKEIEILKITEIVDSLKIEVDEMKMINKKLSDSIRISEATKVIEIEKIKKLPTSEGVEFLKQKLREYEKDY